MPTILCIATYEKGHEFLRECRRQGCRVLLLTADRLRHAAWPHEAIDAFYCLPEECSDEDVRLGVSHVARTERIDRIVALDDFDVEKAALLREHLRVPGMGDTTARYFRDKLAMRVKASGHGILVPEFVHALNDDAIREFAARVPPPWLVKPRSEASAIGIRKIAAATELWPALDALGDRRSFFLIERYVPGDIYHVDSIVSERSVVFAAAHKYGRPPMDVAHEGGIFVTSTLARHAPERVALDELNRRLVSTLGLARGVTHTEFIRGRDDGRFYFLETSARVGGAFIVDTIEAATGINLWVEWARIEIAGEEGRYELPPHQDRYAGLVLTLARQEWPDLGGYTDPEIVRRVTKRHHAGLIVVSDDPGRVQTLVDEYSRRFSGDFFATAPLPDKPVG